jgi:hypothetical protein
MSQGLVVQVPVQSPVEEEQSAEHPPFGQVAVQFRDPHTPLWAPEPPSPPKSASKFWAQPTPRTTSTTPQTHQCLAAKRHLQS